MPTDPEIANDLINNYLKEANKLPFNQSGVPILVKLISEALAEAKKEAENIIFNLEKMVLEYSGTTVPKLHLRIKELEAENNALKIIEQAYSGTATELLRVESQLTTIRSETIDECAKLADYPDTEDIAEAIRKLKNVS